MAGDSGCEDLELLPATLEVGYSTVDVTMEEGIAGGFCVKAFFGKAVELVGKFVAFKVPAANGEAEATLFRIVGGAVDEGFVASAAVDGFDCCGPVNLAQGDGGKFTGFWDWVYMEG